MVAPTGDSVALSRVAHSVGEHQAVFPVQQLLDEREGRLGEERGLGCGRGENLVEGVYDRRSGRDVEASRVLAISFRCRGGQRRPAEF